MEEKLDQYQGMDEDDVFYAEIRRQILLLTADDDESCRERRYSYRQGSKRSVSITNDSSGVKPYGNYFTWGQSEISDYIPVWLVNLWKSGNGTGVFIPNVVKSRRRNNPGRMNNERRIYRPVHSKLQ